MRLSAAPGGVFRPRKAPGHRIRLVFSSKRPMIILMDWRFLQKKSVAKSEAEPSRGRKPAASRIQQLAVVAGLVVVAAAGAGAWFFSQDRGQAGIGAAEPTLASTALTTARDVGAFLRKSVTRDLGNIAGILRRSGEETPGESDTRTEVEVADAGLSVALPTAPRRRREPTAPPELQLGIGPAPWMELPLEAPLFMVFDSSYPDVTPPGAGDIRLRGEFLPGGLRQSQPNKVKPELASSRWVSSKSPFRSVAKSSARS